MKKWLILGVIAVGLTVLVLSMKKPATKKPVKNKALHKSQAENYVDQIEGILNAAMQRGRSLTKAEMAQLNQLQAQLAELGYEYMLPDANSRPVSNWAFAGIYNPN